MISHYEQKDRIQNFSGLALVNAIFLCVNFLCLLYALFSCTFRNDGFFHWQAIYIIGINLSYLGAFPFFMGRCSLDINSKRNRLSCFYLATHPLGFLLAHFLAVHKRILSFYTRFRSAMGYFTDFKRYPGLLECIALVVQIAHLYCFLNPSKITISFPEAA